jgi:hypothetical protein
MISKIKEYESMLRNYYYGEILDYPRFIKQSSRDVWGKMICRVGKDEKGDYYEDRQELENWYITVMITADTKLKDIISECKAFCQEKDANGFTSWEEGLHYTCHQLCDWKWLEGEDGKIIREFKTLHGMKYQVTLVKYAKILKDLEV